MKVLKFGGSSVSSPERIRNVIDIVSKNIGKGDDPVVIFSAFQGITDTLIEAGLRAAAGDSSYQLLFDKIQARHFEAVKELISEDRLQIAVETISKLISDLKQVLYGICLVREISPRSMDYITSFGERFSAYIISEAFLSRGIRAGYLDSREVVKTDKSFGNAIVDFTATGQMVRRYFEDKDCLQVVTGFIGSTCDNETTTLGRGGSDYSASIFGSILNAEEIEIWTDVDGVMTADPRKVKKAFSIDNMSYDEAMEMSHFGAKVIHPPTMRPAMMKNIPIRIKNTFNPSFPGTLISLYGNGKKNLITGITSIGNVALIRVQGSGMVGVAGIARRIFGAMADGSISIILISQASSEHSICFAILPKFAQKAKELIEKELRYEISEGFVNQVVVESNLSIVAAVGGNIRGTSGISGKVLQALGRNGINIAAIAQGSSKLNISMVIPKNDESKALNAIHDAFFLSDLKSINLFVIGTGLIGRTLFQQIKNQLEFLYSHLKIEIKIIAIANTRRMLFDYEGIDVDGWEERLFGKGEESNAELFIERMIGSNLPNSIFVDCTSSEVIMLKYLEILSSSISIVTPNKKANSSNYEYYLQLQKAAQKHSANFLYETNVGAGLPVISTLHDLVFSGDKIHKIEGVLSGTLSYIFNVFDGSNSFSDIVLDARKKGYTEPDPREDLNGLDVARKLLILVRESGYTLELEDIDVENLIPEELRGDISLDEFLEKLSCFDDYYEEKRSKAAKEGKRLRYIASYKDGKATVRLRAVDASHPVYSLTSNDNIIAFTTVYYSERPIVIQGPGAGAVVTSGGIFADIVRIANHLFNR
ncbi:MAG: bifunctional aspartate kinase/homoserine dehydrogenase I [Ignavibacteria bacterium]|jgi:aspartokinase/homoserine dehydrogenase 1|nr:bifunctional aspartate kinase/homoserine dehydrogenase I [Ignavibacteria bacterium]MCU7502160.1 bifunctional aspartate kinase/homoserine dehydrogenase I [Ignavibacteria bacterium]MCU7515562.1 bifunctional aspartate kinase/homoserine dehydrogenase I [Ignavibacteria bacterium]